MPGVVGGTAGGEVKQLGWKDYIALFIALLQTVAVPLLVLIVIILVALAVLRLLH